MEAAGESADVRTELGKIVYDLVWGGGLEAIKLAVLGGNVDYEDSVVVAPHGGAVSVDYVHMEFFYEVAMTEF